MSYDHQFVIHVLLDQDEQYYKKFIILFLKPTQVLQAHGFR